MRWPWEIDKDNKPPPPIWSKEFWTDPKTFLTPRVLIPASILAASSLGLIHFYRGYVRRIPDTSQIYPNFFRKRSLFGTVTSVGDADNFRLYHTPGGRLLGWGWFPGRTVPTDKKELKERTVHIRIAGVDAPECGHFGNPAQHHSAESLEWLRNYILGQRVRAYIYRRDQYDRVVGSVKIWKGLWRRDVGLEMLRAGMAGVYEAKTGAEFGNLEETYRAAEAKAKAQRKGIWRRRGRYESPGTYKKNLKQSELAGGTTNGTSAVKTAGTKASTTKAGNTALPGTGGTTRSGAKAGVVVVGKTGSSAKVSTSAAAAKNKKKL
ncbi:hypothetical protein BDZ91DRAFT_720579 [Kalaharituber pfeilii]|nr:hypothetical protein BDZ91DRAFT_720579 [Kalaharituber pfeilii]